MHIFVIVVVVTVQIELAKGNKKNHQKCAAQQSINLELTRDLTFTIVIDAMLKLECSTIYDMIDIFSHLLIRYRGNCVRFGDIALR